MRHKHKEAFAAAFPKTIPVMTGYIFLGIAFGILLSVEGYGPGWAFLMSLFIYAGSMQFVAVTLLAAAFNPVLALGMTLMINARHLFYSISMLDKFKNTGKLKPYLIFGLTDETFSVLCGIDAPENVDKKWFMFFVTILDQCYWVTGSVIGGFIGSALSFNIPGLDFVLTALFVVIFVGQWLETKEHMPALIGLLCALICRLIFGASNFIIPSMIAILVCFIAAKKPLERRLKL